MEIAVTFLPPHYNSYDGCTGKRMIDYDLAKELTLEDLDEKSIVLNPYAKEELKWIDCFVTNKIVILDTSWEKLKDLQNEIINRDHRIKLRKLPVNIITQNPFHATVNNHVSSIEAAITSLIILGDNKTAIKVAQTIENVPKFIEKNIHRMIPTIPRISFVDSACLFKPLPPPLISISWEITPKCNLQCYYCCTNAGLDKAHSIDYSEAMSIVNELALNDVKEIYFSGGEPLMYPKMIELLSYTINKGLKVSMATNGTLIDDDTASMLHSVGLYLCHVSIDGFKEDHDSIRGNGTYQKTMNGLRSIVKYSIPVRVGIMLSNSNIEYISELTDFLFKIGVNGVLYMMPLPAGRLKNKEKNVDIPPIQVESLKKELTKRYGSKIDFRCTEAEGSNLSNCPGGFNNYHINPEGFCYPCSWVEKIIPDICLGNIRTTDFSEIKKTASYYRTLLSSRLKLNSDCKLCNFRTICGGGCPVRSFINYGSFFHIEPSLCPLSREV